MTRNTMRKYRTLWTIFANLDRVNLARPTLFWSCELKRRSFYDRYKCSWNGITTTDCSLVIARWCMTVTYDTRCNTTRCNTLLILWHLHTVRQYDVRWRDKIDYDEWPSDPSEVHPWCEIVQTILTYDGNLKIPHDAKYHEKYGMLLLYAKIANLIVENDRQHLTRSTHD